MVVQQLSFFQGLIVVDQSSTPAHITYPHSHTPSHSLISHTLTHHTQSHITHLFLYSSKYHSPDTSAMLPILIPCSFKYCSNQWSLFSISTLGVLLPGSLVLSVLGLFISTPLTHSTNPVTWHSVQVMCIQCQSVVQITWSKCHTLTQYKLKQCNYYTLTPSHTHTIISVLAEWYI